MNMFGVDDFKNYFFFKSELEFQCFVWLSIWMLSFPYVYDDDDDET